MNAEILLELVQSHIDFIFMMVYTIIITRIILNIINRELRDRKTQRQLKIDLDYKVQEDDFKLLDHIIQESFNRYCFLNYEKINDEYINTQLQESMIHEILRMSLLRISPLYMTKLNYIYNAQYIEDTMLEKAQSIVIDYCIEVNGNLKE
ncbi:MAG: hypothetical protein PHC62_00910 [Candidatus Izemoplasmatales bacterium]|nr:hypothetical protein [Candidatus Izemoplasmatales bacterium]